MLKQVQHDMKRIKKSHHKPSRGFCKKDVIASVSEAISNKLKDCHVAIAPRNDVTVWRNSEKKGMLGFNPTKRIKGEYLIKYLEKKSLAFTLAEVLITLAIIGVVAAMTIPTINTKNQKRIIESRVTQDFSIIQQVLRLQTVDGLNMTGDIKDFDTSLLKFWFEKYWAPYMKTVKVCYDSAGCWQNKGDNKNLAGNPVYCNRRAIGIGVDVITVVLPNGSYLCIDVYTRGSIQFYFGITTKNRYGVVMFVDANGNTPPNTVGKDIYAFVYAEDVGLVPAGTHETKETIDANCSNTSTGENAGYFCLAKIKMDSWKILDQVWNR